MPVLATDAIFKPFILLLTVPIIDRFMAVPPPMIEDLPSSCPMVSLEDTGGLGSMDKGTSRFNRLNNSYHPFESVRHMNISPTLSPDKRYLRIIQ